MLTKLLLMISLAAGGGTANGNYDLTLLCLVLILSTNFLSDAPLKLTNVIMPNVIYPFLSLCSTLFLHLRVEFYLPS